MDGDAERGRLRTFVLGGLVGASAALAAARRRRRRVRDDKRPPRAGLAAFEDAPCYVEVVEQERLERRERGT
jgi:hypothetical protein